MLTLDLTPKQHQLLISSAHYSLNAVEAKIKDPKYYPVEPDSHYEGNLDGLMKRRASYIKILRQLKEPNAQPS